MSNESLIQELIRSGHLRTPRIIDALRKIDRKDFVIEEYKDKAYANHPLPIGFGQTISQPLTVAFMLEHLAPEPGERILEIGGGSGWQAALLAHIVSSGNRHGRIICVERIAELKEMAERNANRYGFVERKILTVVAGDGAKGYPPGAPYGKIIAAAAAKRIPVAWKEQLYVGGRLVAPVEGSIKVIEKLSSSNFTEKNYEGFSFVPLVTERLYGDGG